MKIKKIFIILLILLTILFVMALAGSIKFPMSQSFRMVFGSFYVLFLPGFIWSYVFFGSKKQESKKTQEPSSLPLRQINSADRQDNPPLQRAGKITKKQKNGEISEKPLDGIERILLSFALSLALSPLLLFFLNKVGVAINLLNSFLVILGIIIIGTGIIAYKNYKEK